MKITKRNMPLALGLFLFSCAQIASHIVDVPDTLLRILMLSALALELWGVFMVARSPAMKNSKLRQWKLRLIGKGEK